MPTIEIETIPLTNNEFDLIHNFAEGATYYDEKHIPFDANAAAYEKLYEKRLIAAICNLGFACKWFADRATLGTEEFRLVKIPTDQDGPDHRFDGEHDTLYALLFPANDYQSRRLHSLYAEYMKYLNRIQELEWRFHIKIERT